MWQIDGANEAAGAVLCSDERDDCENCSRAACARMLHVSSSRSRARAHAAREQFSQSCARGGGFQSARNLRRWWARELKGSVKGDGGRRSGTCDVHHEHIDEAARLAEPVAGGNPRSAPGLAVVRAIREVEAQEKVVEDVRVYHTFLACCDLRALLDPPEATLAVAALHSV